MRRFQDFTDDLIDQRIEFAADDPTLRGIIWDKQVPGLRLYVGKRKTSWQFYADTCEKGDRGHIFETLGRYDVGRFAGVVSGPAHTEAHRARAPWHVGVAEARDRAKVHIGRRIEGTAPPNAREGTKFADAFESYVAYLENKAREKGKPPRWARNVRALGRKYLVPKWGNWTLQQLSDDPEAVAEWIAQIESAVTANHCARVMRALYRRAAKRNRKLSLENAPTTGVDYRKEKRKQKGMIARQFPAWFEAWQAVKSPIRKAFYLANLLTGMRPGELSRTVWNDYDRDARTLTIGNSKAGNVIIIPVSDEIADALDMAAKVHPAHKSGDRIFPGCERIQHRDRGELPVMGHALRRTWKTFAQNEVGVREEITATLIGHVPEGQSQKYVLQWARHHGAEIIAAQAKISKAIMAALKAKPARKLAVAA